MMMKQLNEGSILAHRRVMHIIETTGPGGAESIFLAIVKGMVKKGYQSFPCIAGPGWVYNNLTELGMSPEIVRSDKKFDIAYLMRLISFARMNNIDLIHSHLLGSNFYASLAGKILGIPVLATFHGAVDKGAHQGRFIALKMFLIALCSARVITVSHILKKELCRNKLLFAKKWVVVHNGIDLAKFKGNYTSIRKKKKALGFREDHVVIGTIGNIRPAKGYKYLMESASLVRKDFANVKYLIVGEGKQEDMKGLVSLVQRLGLKDIVTFLGFRTDIAEILGSFDLFIIPSISEGFSMATVEALAAGVPVVATRSGGPEEIITHEKDGLLVPHRDPQALYNATVRLLKDKDLAASLSSNGKETANKFSLSHMLDNYENIYLEVMR